MKPSDWLMVALFVQYVALTIASIIEAKWGPILYWLGAAVIVSGAFLMKRGL